MWGERGGLYQSNQYNQHPYNQHTNKVVTKINIYLLYAGLVTTIILASMLIYKNIIDNLKTRKDSQYNTPPTKIVERNVYYGF